MRLFVDGGVKVKICSCFDGLTKSVYLPVVNPINSPYHTLHMSYVSEINRYKCSEQHNFGNFYLDVSTHSEWNEQWTNLPAILVIICRLPLFRSFQAHSSSCFLKAAHLTTTNKCIYFVGPLPVFIQSSMLCVVLLFCSCMCHRSESFRRLCCFNKCGVTSNVLVKLRLLVFGGAIQF